MLYQVYMVALLIVGFGLVVFVHEMGHFLAAKWMGVKVEQFALGFGPAVFSWRKGLGWVRGSSNDLFQKKLSQHIRAHIMSKPESATSGQPTPRQLQEAARELGMSETEYRINWLPLGGYVKMLGQDDLKPNAESSDPRAYNRKSIGARMVIVSAGVIMNVIFAALGFMLLFLIGFHTPAPIVGGVLPDSPAQHAGLRVGDTILSIDGVSQPDFTRIALTTALLQEGKEVPVVVDRPGQGKLTFSIRPERLDPNVNRKIKGLLSFGIVATSILQGPPLEVQDDWKTISASKGINPDSLLLNPGDTVTSINGQAVGKDDFEKLDRILQDSQGQPLSLLVKAADSKTRTVLLQPHFEVPFGVNPLNFAGLQPRVQVEAVTEDSKALGKVEVGDIIVGIEGDGSCEIPNRKQFFDLVKKTAEAKKSVSLQVLRDSKLVKIEPIQPTTKLAAGNSDRGLGVAPSADDLHAVTTAPLPDSAAARAKNAAGDTIPAGAEIVSIDSQPVHTWFDVRRLLLGPTPFSDHPTHHALRIAGNDTPFNMVLSDADVQNLRDMQLTQWLDLQQMIIVRKTHNPLTAASWGVGETRYFILEFYVTLRDMFQGSISVRNMMGPVGMVYAGAKLAFAGFDKLLWFLALISANLAVVNFLPIPVVDGGLFAFLILEKIQGRPLSNRAQVAWQIVGLALILGIFVLVTCQDISNFLP